MKHQQHIVAILASTISHDTDELKMIAGDITGADVIIAQRAMLEQNPAYRQIIPYTILQCGNKFAAYRRTKSGGESRLHDLISIGFGGHVDMVDVAVDKESSIIDLDSTIRIASEREISEELLFGKEVVIESVTTMKEKIVSNRSDVDKVHIGLVSTMVINSEDVISGEDQLDFMGFFTPSELRDMGPLESWTEGLLQIL